MDDSVNIISEQEAQALLEKMASFAGPAVAELQAALTATGTPEASAPGSSKSWRPDLRYRSLVERLPVVTFMASLDDTIQEVYVSPQIETLLGFTQEQWIDNPILWFRQLHPDDRDNWVAEFAKTVANGANFRSEYRMIAKDGRIVWIQGECQLIRDEVGRPVFLQGIAFDITHLKEAAKIEDAKLAAEASNRAKSEFLARMSHEIRTPLNGVVGMIDLLRSTDLTDSQERYAHLARESANTLMRVINDILDFSKIEAGKIDIESIEFELPRLIQDLTELLSPMAAKKGLVLASRLCSDVPRRALGDPSRIRQVLTNLVNNALKFTSSGSVTIRGALQTNDETDLMIRVEVQDTGIGIPPDRLDRLFKSFSQVDTSTTRKYGGTGLGLVISKQLVELMGGQIGIDSIEGKGTTFWFTLKLGAVAASTDDDASILEDQSATRNDSADSADNLSAMKGLHLLVAEDNEMNQFVTQETLRLAGCTCEIVGDGAQAVEAARRGGFDVILMDCQMPVMDGLEAAGRIRAEQAANPAGPQPPIIALTAEALQGDRERCLAAGMHGYVTKPINVNDLYAEINSLIGRGTTDRAKAPTTEAPIAEIALVPLATAAESIAPIDVQSLLSRCLNDADFAIQTLEEFNTQTAEDVEFLRQVIKIGDLETATKLAHVLTIGAVHAGALPLEKIAAEIERAGTQRDVKLVEQQLTALAEEARRCVEFVGQAREQITRTAQCNAKR